MWLGGLLVLVLIDQGTKQLVFSGRYRPSWVVLFENHQLAFSVHAPIAVVYAVYAVALAVAAITAGRNFLQANRFERLGWVLVLAGGVSNFAERVVRGSVRDFIPLADGVLNIADFYILTGAVLLLWVFRRRT